VVGGDVVDHVGLDDGGGALAEVALEAEVDAVGGVGLDGDAGAADEELVGRLAGLVVGVGGVSVVVELALGVTADGDPVAPRLLLGRDSLGYGFRSGGGVALHLGGLVGGKGTGLDHAVDDRVDVGAVGADGLSAVGPGRSQGKDQQSCD